MRTMTLSEVLTNPSVLGLPDLPPMAKKNEAVRLRFQTVFVPCDDDGSAEFVAECFNYMTLEDNDPQNMLLMCTPAGVTVRQDMSGCQRLFVQSSDGKDGVWIRASAGQCVHCLHSEEAVSSAPPVGIMGQRANVVMTVQVPLQQQEPLQQWGWGDDLYDQEEHVVYRSVNIADISNGAVAEHWRAPTQNITRNYEQPITATVVMYYTVVGTPSDSEVHAAIDHMHALNMACNSKDLFE